MAPLQAAPGNTDVSVIPSMLKFVVLQAWPIAVLLLSITSAVAEGEMPDTDQTK